MEKPDLIIFNNTILDLQRLIQFCAKFFSTDNPQAKVIDRTINKGEGNFKIVIVIEGD